MASAGTLIVIEGIDGAGKRTQAELLARALEARGISCAHFTFPRYESSFGRLVGRFLNGEFGGLETVDPHFSALLYAGDRFEAKNDLLDALESGKTILADRYIASNLAHQTARVVPARREEFMAWLRHLEYGIYGLPKEDLVIFLRRAPAEAQQMVGRKKARQYTESKRDLQESDLTHLEQAALLYDQLASTEHWATVECDDTVTGASKTREEIHKAVLDAVVYRILTGTPVS